MHADIGTKWNSSLISFFHETQEKTAGYLFSILWAFIYVAILSICNLSAHNSKFSRIFFSVMSIVWVAGREMYCIEY